MKSFYSLCWVKYFFFFLVFVKIVTIKFTIQPKPFMSEYTIFIKLSKPSNLSVRKLTDILIAIGKVKISLTLSSEVRYLSTVYLTFGISNFSFSLQVSTDPVSLKNLSRREFKATESMELKCWKASCINEVIGKSHLSWNQLPVIENTSEFTFVIIINLSVSIHQVFDPISSNLIPIGNVLPGNIRSLSLVSENGTSFLFRLITSNLSFTCFFC